MKRLLYYFSLIVFICSCKLQADTNREYDKYDPAKTYKLRVNPAAGSGYHYDITNETEMNQEVEGKEIENINQSERGMNYKISKDCGGNLVFTLNV